LLLQSLIVALLVAACCVYVAWSLLPAAARRAVAVAMLRVPLPAGAARFMRKHAVASAAGGCACEGCEHAGAAVKAPAEQPVIFQRRPQNPR